MQDGRNVLCDDIKHDWCSPEALYGYLEMVAPTEEDESKNHKQSRLHIKIIRSHIDSVSS